MIDKLIKVQNELKAPKNQRNNFGKYNYRNCEDILEAVKPLLFKHGLLLTITDEVKRLECDNVTTSYVKEGFSKDGTDIKEATKEEKVAGMYVEATATISDGGKEIFVKAQAGIDPNRKGMDIAQSYGSSSSYARKYALNGLFLIDDTKDADATNTHGKAKKTTLVKNTPAFNKVKEALSSGNFTIAQVESKYTLSEEVKSLLTK
ncbi:erf family protein [uncultured Mediterranean phage uvMED]|nr:erf family protein [uncultured Mediterranean phage uvMED]